MIDRKEMAWPAARGDRDRDFSRECLLWEEIEEDLEQAAVCRALNRGADDNNPCVQHGLNGLGHVAIFAAAEQSVSRQCGEIDEPGRPGALPLECRERQLEQRTRARDRLGAAGQANNGCRHSFLLQKAIGRDSYRGVAADHGASLWW